MSSDEGAAADDTDSPALWSTLPLSLTLKFLALLPVEERARCACVCRAWRDYLADPLEWLVLNVEFPDASRRRRMSEAALRGAAGRARGRLRELVLESSLLLNPSEDVACLIEELVTANGASLRKLRVGRKDLPEGEKPPAFLSRLLSLAPSLAELDARNLSFSVSQETCDVLRGLPPFQTGVVRVPILLLETDPAGDGDVHSVEDMLAVVAAAEAHAPLKGVQIIGYLRPEEVDAFIALAARRKLEEVHFHEGLFAPDSTPVLAGLLQQKSLEILYLCNDDEFDQDAMFDVWGAQLFASALRANCTLKLLTLESPRLFDGALGCSLLIAAATAHPSLAVLTLTIKEPDWDARLIAHPLAALVAANSSVFECLRISCEGLGDEGLRPLALALPQNKHVVVLTCESCGLSEAFMRDCFLPVVAAHSSLVGVLATQSHDEALSDELNESRNKMSTRLYNACAPRWPPSQHKDEVEAQLEEEHRAASAVATLTDGVAAL